jgi:hypothetical protein
VLPRGARQCCEAGLRVTSASPVSLVAREAGTVFLFSALAPPLVTPTPTCASIARCVSATRCRAARKLQRRLARERCGGTRMRHPRHPLSCFPSALPAAIRLAGTQLDTTRVSPIAGASGARGNADHFGALSPLLASLHLALRTALHVQKLHGCVVPRHGDACYSMGSHAAWADTPCMPSPKRPSLPFTHTCQ